jgi:hypothetical protein
MFERYTERARRMIFFARYEASQFGSTTGTQVQEGALFVFILQPDGRIVLVGRETPNSGEYPRFLRI